MQWHIRPADPTLVADLARSAGLSETVARLLVQRRITDEEAANRFLRPSLSDLHPPLVMLGMSAAVERLERAIVQKERILIYGDYDVDGTVAVVILKTCIEMLGGVADFHVPHRIREGYGMKDEVIEGAAAEGVRLVISVDTGIRAFDAAEAARRSGLDLIVTDHHLPEADERVPHALAVLNPNQRNCSYPNKNLCGAGVAFKLVQALLTNAGRESLLPSFLKMVAIATIADSVPLTGENRAIAKLGLAGLRRPVNGGLKALMQVAQLDQAHLPPGKILTAGDIGFRVAPRINAAGRMDVAGDVVELFTTKDDARAGELAAKLNQLNSERQAEEQRILAEIGQQLENDPAMKEVFCLVIAGEGWHRGVIGITATRVVERTGKPALVVAYESGAAEAHGSGRSIASFHLLEALESHGCRDLFTRFGGHAHAVGFTLPTSQIPCLRNALNQYARTRLTAKDFLPGLEADTETTLDQLTPELMAEIGALEPFGMGNREPVFVVRTVKLVQPPRVLKEEHVKLRVMSSTANGNKARAFDAMGWRLAKSPACANLQPGDTLDIAFTLDENFHPEFGGLQLVIRDINCTSQTAAVTVGE